MPNFGPRWQKVDTKSFERGGQCRAYLVRDAQDDRSGMYVAKVLDGSDEPNRRQRLLNEIERCREFDHPNVVRLVDSGETVKSGYPFLVLPYYEEGSVEVFRSKLQNPLETLSFFAEICEGVAYVHEKGIVHRDIKPANIFVARNRRPVVGDFGISYRDTGDRLTRTMEVVAARWFGAPELRNGYLENPTPAADVYSLGKLLYWLFTGCVYDREEQDYGTEERRLVQFLDRSVPAYSFVDDLVEATVKHRPADRSMSAKEFGEAARRTIGRIQAGGHALDLRLPQRCLFCGTGEYQPLDPLPQIEQRLAPRDPRIVNPYAQPDIYKEMRDRAKSAFGSGGTGGGHGSLGPLFLICQHCGNVQEFRLDLAPEAVKNWKP